MSLLLFHYNDKNNYNILKSYKKNDYIKRLGINNLQIYFVNGSLEKVDIYKGDDELPLVVFTGNFYNFDNIHKKVNVAKEKNRAKVISQYYKKFGTKIFEEIDGEFALLIYEIESQVIYAGRDHMGTVPLFYYSQKGEFVISTCSHAISYCSEKKLNQDWITSVLQNRQPKLGSCPIESVYSIPAGNYIRYQKGVFEKRQYWNLGNISIQSKITKEVAVNQFKKTIMEAIKKRIFTASNLGVELSGGLDSSGIASFIVSNMSKDSNLNSFSNILPQNLLDNNYPMKDELIDIIDVLKYLRIENNKNLISSEKSGLIDSIRTTIGIIGWPIHNNFVIFNDDLFKTVKDNNIDYLFSGFGGDQLISNRGGGVYDELAYKNQFITLFKLIYTKRQPVLSLKRFLKYIFKIKFNTLYTQILRILGNDYFFNHDSSLALSKWVLENYNSDELDLQKSTNTRYNYLDKLCENLSKPSFNNRLETSFQMGQYYGFAYKYPLLDRKLQEFYYSLPVHLKLNKNINRYIYRLSLQGMLPENIVMKFDKHGAVFPAAYHRFENDKNNIKEYLHNLKSKGLKNRYIDIDKMILWYDKMCEYKKLKSLANPVGFIKYLTILIYLEEFHDGPQ